MKLRLSDEVIVRFAAAMRAGETFCAAAQTVDVDVSTAHRWRRLGEGENGTLRARFAAAVNDARAQLAAAGMTEGELLAVLEQQARRGSVRAAVWLLEHRHGWSAGSRSRAGEPQDDADDPFAELDRLAPPPRPLAELDLPDEAADEPSLDELAEWRRLRARQKDSPAC